MQSLEHCLIEDDQTVAQDLDPHRKKLTASPREDSQTTVGSRRARSSMNVTYIDPQFLICSNSLNLDSQSAIQNNFLEFS